MDNLIRGATDSLAWRFHCVPRSGRTDPPVACIRSDFLNPPFCNGQTSSVDITGSFFIGCQGDKTGSASE